MAGAAESEAGAVYGVRAFNVFWAIGRPVNIKRPDSMAGAAEGSDFSTTININDDNTNLPQDLTGYTVTGSLRRSLVSPNASANLVCSIYNVNGGISISLDSANTAILRPGPYFFDVKTYNTTTHLTSRLIEGVIFVTPSISK